MKVRCPQRQRLLCEHPGLDDLQHLARTAAALKRDPAVAGIRRQSHRHAKRGRHPQDGNSPLAGHGLFRRMAFRPRCPESPDRAADQHPRSKRHDHFVCRHRLCRQRSDRPVETGRALQRAGQRRTNIFELVIPDFGNFDIAALVFKPALNVCKTSAALSDLVNSTANLKLIPGRQPADRVGFQRGGERTGSFPRRDLRIDLQLCRPWQHERQHQVVEQQWIQLDLSAQPQCERSRSGGHRCAGQATRHHGGRQFEIAAPALPGE